MPVMETSNQPTFPAGVYRHRESGEELVAIETEKFGNPQAAAFVRMGFEYVGPVSKDALAQPEKQEKGKLTLPGDPFSDQGPQHNVYNADESSEALAARLQAAKAREADAQRHASNNASLAAKSQKESAKSTQKGAK